ncbi:aromatic acid exporter family protein [Ferdinandcohnia quinoae]|uniref:Aromatic acid exporter family protein n=1 Tax=Fredinandcohnia quinoae TaxID=2918902 RepID=A0AAW5E162_9BACI|nr:aromatic acid exporter family protein [Fredinandcohnia sp. SECRCQ15]MCH1626655.1 aromatic acid exporter family protein [Fredinandcohnia sp. SECRCQ15]
MFKIGYRTIKTAIGTMIAVFLAKWMGLDSYTSAGILTILCIKVTKKKSFQSSWERFIACAVGILFSFIFFEGLGYHPISIGILLLFFIPTLVAIKAKDGVITSAVIILHIFSAGKVTMHLVLNQLGLIIIGVGVALLINLYMPSVDKKLKQYQQDLEDNFGKIFSEMVNYLHIGESNWDGKEITMVEELIKKAKTLASRDSENRLLREENQYYLYFEMREKQFEIIQRMLPIITSITHSVEQGKIVAHFIEEISESIHPGNTARKYLRKLEEMRETFRDMPLPKTREEFEARAALLQFVKEMEEYLYIKSMFKGIYNERR